MSKEEDIFWLYVPPRMRWSAWEDINETKKKKKHKTRKTTWTPSGKTGYKTRIPNVK